MNAWHITMQPAKVPFSLRPTPLLAARIGPPPVGKVEPPDIVRRENALGILEIVGADQFEAELSADAVGPRVFGRRVGVDVAVGRNGLEADQRGSSRSRPKAAPAMARKDFPAHFVDRLAGLFAAPIDDGADDFAVGRDAQNLDVAGVVIGEVALMAVEQLCFALRTAQMSFLFRRVHGLEEGEAALVPGHEVDLRQSRLTRPPPTRRCAWAVPSLDAGSGRCTRPDSARGNPGARARPPRKGRPARVRSPPCRATAWRR